MTRVGAVRLERAETAETWSADVSRKVGAVEVSGTWFGSRIHSPVVAHVFTNGPPRLEVFNQPQGTASSTRTWGAELFGRFRSGPWVATATHTWVNATQAGDLAGMPRENVPLTPRRTFSLIAAWEKHGVARVLSLIHISEPTRPY